MKLKIGVIGLGYVGLPLLVALTNKYEAIGFDIDKRRVRMLSEGVDVTGEIKDQAILSDLHVTAKLSHLSECNFYIITVPTPINEKTQPDLRPLIAASADLGHFLKPGDIVVFESTVFPGATREICIPELEKFSGLNGGTDFYFGYSPERINPGDVGNSLKKVVKVTSGCCDFSANQIDEVYSSIIPAGTFRAASVEVAEASKVIENVQRDVNIAIVNEASIIFAKLGIDVNDVIEAASTKWNFQRFSPGLVGGHCIGIDPYYLISKSTSVGVVPKLFLAARERNESMVDWHLNAIIDTIANKNLDIKSDKFLFLGLSFKPNVPDIRNSKSIELFMKLRNVLIDIDVYDPHMNRHDIVNIVPSKVENSLPDLTQYAMVIVAVSHDVYREEILALQRNGGNVYVI